MVVPISLNMMSKPDQIDHNITILVIDDQALTRSMVKSILKGLGYAVVLVAENGPIALELLETEKVDIIICDWNMPQMSGLEFLKKVRANPATRKIPFLMLTAEAYRENVSAAIAAGVSDYIAKPFTPDVLANKVESTLKRARNS